MAIPNEYQKRRHWYALANSASAVSAGADTNEDTLATITVPANALGANGRLRVSAFYSFTNSANNKTLRARLGGASGTIFATVTLTTQLSARVLIEIMNRNATGSQVGSGGWFHTAGSSFNGKVTSAIDTTADVDLVLTGQKASSGDTLTLEDYLVELLYGA